jgi:hypothetical protein
MVTITTVRYGGKVPISPGGRGVAVVLMLGGIALLGVLTATVATTPPAPTRKSRYFSKGRMEADWEVGK